MHARTRKQALGIAAAALLAAGTIAIAPAQAATAAPIVIDTGANVSFVNNCDYPVGVSIATDWREHFGEVWPIDEVFVLQPGETEAFTGLQPRTADGELYAVMYYVASSGMGSDIFKEGVLPQSFAEHRWYACGFPTLG